LQNPGRQEECFVNVRVESEDLGIGTLDGDGDMRSRPVEAEVPDQRAKQHNVAEIPAAQDQNPL
jgi:hypothetical protein